MESISMMEAATRTAEQGLLAGCPKDQVERFIAAGYAPTTKQWEFHAAARRADRYDGPRIILMGGARGGAKSHANLAQVGIDDAQRVPGLKVLFLRQIQKAAKESFDDLVQRIFFRVPHTWSPSTGRLTFPNGSRIIMGGFKDQSDIDKYLGIEYDLMVVEEATQLNREKHTMLEGSLRTSKPNWRPRAYWTTNPGGIGHAYVKARCVIPYRQRNERETRFIPATYRDNPFLDPDYVKYLEGLTGALARAWREGDWDIFEGQAFPQLNKDIHMINGARRFPEGLPDFWPKWRAVDWGYTAPWVVGWFARDPNTGQRHLYRVLRRTGLTDVQQARLIVEHTPPSEQIALTYADPSMWASKTADQIVTTAAQTYALNGVPLTKANNDRIEGKRRVDAALAIQANGEPGLVIWDTCEDVIDRLQELIYDEHHPEDIDTDGDDHDYDMIRYGLTNDQFGARARQQQERARRRRISPLAEVFRR